MRREPIFRHVPLKGTWFVEANRARSDDSIKRVYNL